MGPLSKTGDRFKNMVESEIRDTIYELLRSLINIRDTSINEQDRTDRLIELRDKIDPTGSWIRFETLENITRKSYKV